MRCLDVLQHQKNQIKSGRPFVDCRLPFFGKILATLVMVGLLFDLVGPVKPDDQDRSL